MTKKWSIRKENNSKIIKTPYIFLGDYGWVVDESLAKVFKTKKEAMQICELTDGEVYSR